MFPAVSVASSPPLSHLLIVNISVVKLQDIYYNTAIHSEDSFVKTLLCGIYCAKNVSVFRRRVTCWYCCNSPIF